MDDLETKDQSGYKAYSRPGRVRMGAATEADLNRAAFRIEIEKCEKCGGKVEIIACLEDPEVIQKILKHSKI